MTVEMQEFDGMLDDVLHGMVNASAPDGLAERVSGRIRMPRESVVAAPVFRVATKEAGLLESLWNGIRETLWPKKLPPLVLVSQPVPVMDRMADDRGYRGRVWALAMHGVAILLIGVIVRAQVELRTPVKPAELVVLTAPPKLPVKASVSAGGGGQHELTPATKGAPPKFAEMPIVPPKAPPMMEAKIHVDPAVDVQQDVKMKSDLPQIGVANSPVVGMSMGNGHGSGVGPGNGDGYGPGEGGGMGGGVRQVGGGVSEPVPIYQVDPGFSEEARRARVEGIVMVNIHVEKNGLPSHVHVVQSIGMGLDEKAVDAVKQYRFKPAMENGRPVVVEMDVMVHFQIY